MTETWLPLVTGFVLLLVGGESLVRGAVQTAERIGISPLVISMTLVGFGTSIPELVTSVQAGLNGSPGIAYGNVVGSNISNILLIAGVSALICPIAVARSALRRDTVVMLVAGVAFAALTPFILMGRLAGAALIAALLCYICFMIRQERLNADSGVIHDKSLALSETDPGLAPPHVQKTVLLPLLIAIVGLVLILLGGSFLVSGAVALARSFHVSETIIGVTIVGVGTSMPELVTSAVAAFRRQGDVAFGNIVGSNIYNILGIGGATALIAPTDVPREIAYFHAPVMVGVFILMTVFAATGLRIGRREGLTFLAGYIVYLYALWP